MSQFNRITTRCLQSCWCGAALVQAVTGAPLVWMQFTGGRHPVVAGGERLVGKHRVVSARVPIDLLSAYVIISGKPPSHAGSGSKQTHVVNSEPMGSNSKYYNISINKHCLTMKNKYVI